MKKCPYCAEEIQDKAVICRYCNRYISGVRFHRIFHRAITIIIIAILVFFAATHQVAIRQKIYKVRLFFYKLDNLEKYFEEIIELIKDGLKAIKDYRRPAEGDKLIEKLEKGEN